MISVDDIRTKVVPILKGAGIKRSSLFGSYVRGEETEDSDIDMLVEVPDDTSLLDLVRLEMKLERVLQKKVDLLTYDSVSPYLRDIIQKEQLSIL
jgi:hypothetical protein